MPSTTLARRTRSIPPLLRSLARYGRSSLALDTALLASTRLPIALRYRFLVEKHRALAVLPATGRATLRLDPLRFTVTNVSGLGTLQSALVDVHDMLIAPGVLPRDRPVVADVGANIGQFAAATLLTCHWPQLDCFEPEPAAFNALQANLAGQPGTAVHRHAAGAEPARATLYRHELSVMSSLRPAVPGYRAGDHVTVEVVPLDSALQHLDHIDLLKVDVEGGELDVLRGARQVLPRTRFLLVELGLTRDTAGESLDCLCLVKQVCPRARLLRVGRPLGSSRHPICQDVLIDLQGSRPYCSPARTPPSRTARTVDDHRRAEKRL